MAKCLNTAARSQGLPIAWILALVVAALVGFLLGRAQGGDALSDRNISDRPMKPAVLFFDQVLYNAKSMIDNYVRDAVASRDRNRGMCAHAIRFHGVDMNTEVLRADVLAHVPPHLARNFSLAGYTAELGDSFLTATEAREHRPLFRH
ncbi:MAG: hypothetical protein ACLQUZ_01770 [Rhizomicrobium sp.]